MGYEQRCCQCNKKVKYSPTVAISALTDSPCWECAEKERKAERAASQRDREASRSTGASASSSGGGAGRAVAGAGAGLASAGVGIAGAGIGALAGGVGALAKGAGAAIQNHVANAAAAEQTAQEILAMPVPSDMDELLQSFLFLSSRVEYRVTFPIYSSVPLVGQLFSTIGVMLEGNSARVSDLIISKLEALSLGWKTGAVSRPDYAAIIATLDGELANARAKKEAALAKAKRNRTIGGMLLAASFLIQIVFIGFMRSTSHDTAGSSVSSASPYQEAADRLQQEAEARTIQTIRVDQGVRDCLSAEKALPGETAAGPLLKLFVNAHGQVTGASFSGPWADAHPAGIECLTTAVKAVRLPPGAAELSFELN